MPRITVTTEPTAENQAAMVLDEHIASNHLESDHSADQLIERIGWALSDAEETEQETERLTPSR